MIREVELVVGTETRRVDVEADVLAREDALVDLARQQAGVSPAEFRTGRVVE
ncbi:hypothetical protein GWK26_08520 [haloarchaeon 3A1-DGR]|nr:hypothetical protein GWK26_08520 [haloarchaeon 3A1-DGR]